MAEPITDPVTTSEVAITPTPIDEGTSAIITQLAEKLAGSVPTSTVESITEAITTQVTAFTQPETETEATLNAAHKEWVSVNMGKVIPFEGTVTGGEIVDHQRVVYLDVDGAMVVVKR